MQAINCAVIAAAGLGSRIGLGMPKCMIEIDGISILTRLLNAVRPHVSSIHIVVGYREEMIIDYCAKNHRDVIIVRNPQYRTTNTAQSLAQGAQHINGKVAYIDGDLIISPESLAAFFSRASEQKILVGVTNAKSENAVFIHGHASDKLIEVSRFSRKCASQYEWANIVVGPSHLMNHAKGYVFERLEENLPLCGCLLDLAEVDTADDLDAAIKFTTTLDAHSHS